MDFGEGKVINLVPPPDYNCINCSANFTNQNGAINEIHIYTATNEFERSISILDALFEIFATEQLKCAKSSDFNILMCTKCAEIMSFMYKYYLNLTAQALSSTGSYLCQLITHVDDLCQSQDESKYYPITSDLGLNDDDARNHYIPCVDYGANSRESEEARRSRKTRSQTPREIQHVPLNRHVNNGIRGVAKLEPRLFKCHQSSCDFTERYNFKLFEHLLSFHQKKDPSTCRCGFKYYPEIYKLETHICIKKSANSKKGNPGVFSCEVCGIVFRGKKLLWHHLEKIHVLDDVKFACQRSECGKKLNSRRRLLFHLELHHQNSRLHLCSECGRTFKLRSTLMKHVKLHRLSLEEKIQFNRNRIEKNKGPLGSYECMDCDRTYTRRIYLKDHIKYKHQPGSWKYKCLICEKPYFHQQRLRSHIKTHDPSHVRIPGKIRSNSQSKYFRPSIEILRPFVCLVCNKRFKYKAFLLTHEKMDHVCKVGVEVHRTTDTALDTTLIPHSIDPDTEIPFGGSNGVIQEADMKNGTESEFVEMQQNEKNPDADQNPVLLPFLPYKPQQEEWKAWKCDQCGKTFTKMRALNVHYRTHTGEAPELFTCITCNHQFRRKFQLKEHVKKKHPPKEGPEKENELTKLNLSLDAVVASAGGTKERFQCHVCSNFFADKKYLGKHLLSHTGAHRKIPCPLCDYKTSTRTLLKGHMRTNHKDAIPEQEKNRWTCDTCQKSFAAQRNLREHRLIHTGEIFRFPCTVDSCGEKFRSKTSQESHLFTYHPETLSADVLDRWKCSDCGKPFGNRKNLTEHQRMHKGIHLRIACSLCGLGMRHKAALESHIRSKHKKGKKKCHNTLNVSPSSIPVKRGRGRPRKRVVISSSSEEDEEEKLDLGTFWRCDICHRSFSVSRGLSRAEHMRIKHPVTTPGSGGGDT